jgi:alkanesulfonate monooxygenase SsuD/methylene tetrahydromethanopterin reductase-like flavin-dependent oxidoreductase (luciferase family)
VQQQIAMFGDGGPDAEAWLGERIGRWIIGTPDAAHEAIENLGAAGAQRIMLQDFLPRDLEMVTLLGRIAAG